MGRVEVLEPSTASCAHEVLDLGERLLLDRHVFKHGLDHQVRAGHIRGVGGGGDLRQQGVGLLLGLLAPSPRPCR